jgi:hypothetical protein
MVEIMTLTRTVQYFQRSHKVYEMHYQANDYQLAIIQSFSNASLKPLVLVLDWADAKDVRALYSFQGGIPFSSRSPFGVTWEIHFPSG